MLCPNCKKELFEKTIGQITVSHCAYCGMSMFDQNNINRISLQQAVELKKDRIAHFISGNEKNCSVDSSPLASIKSQAVPQHVTLLECHHCKRVYAFAEDLVEFKKAQKARLDFLRIWRLPVPSLKTIAVYMLPFFIGIGIFYSLFRASRVQNQAIQANEVIKSIRISQSADITFVYFTTQSPFSTDAIFINRLTGQQIRKTVNQTPKTVHLLLVPEIGLSPDILMTIVLKTGGTEIKTPSIPFLPR